MDLQFEQLRTFAAVIDEGTFDSAAIRLQVTPSAVSQRIKALEQQVGRVLVQRTKPARATESGLVVMRLARQVERLEQDALATLGSEPVRANSGERHFTTLPLVVNADSLATWVMPALANVAQEFDVAFEVHREDESHSTSLLREGTVMAAVTSSPDAVQGCEVHRLGKLRYRPVATPQFVTQWFPAGASGDALAAAPVVDFDRKDELQTRFLRRLSRRRLLPPRHYVPASADYATAVKLGLGWGLLPEMQIGADLRDGHLVEFAPGRAMDVPLYWQHWKLDSRILTALSQAVYDSAGAVLR